MTLLQKCTLLSMITRKENSSIALRRYTSSARSHPSGTVWPVWRQFSQTCQTARILSGSIILGVAPVYKSDAMHAITMFMGP